MQSESTLPLLVRALERFRSECLPRMAREEAYSGWIAHFLMLEFGARRVIVESHHDGRALSSALRQHLKPGYESWLPEAEGRGGAMNYDIVVARHDDVDARTFQTRFRGHARATIDERRREAARHLLQFVLLMEVKLVDCADDLVVTDMMVRDLIKLAATSITIDEFCEGAETPETAFIVVVRGERQLPKGAAGFIAQLSERAAAALERNDGIVFPRVFLVAHSAVEST